MRNIIVIGIDIAKKLFQVCAVSHHCACDQQARPAGEVDAPSLCDALAQIQQDCGGRCGSNQ
jgi:hypothetical protein